MGVVGYGNFTGHDCEVFIVLNKPVPPGCWQTWFDYPFRQLGCLRITARVQSTNERSIRLVERLGFKAEGLIRKGTPEADVWIYGLLKEEVYGQEVGTDPSASA